MRRKILIGFAALAVLLVLAATYLFMGHRVAERETQCRQRCAASGYKGYLYTPPAGSRPVSRDQCECTK